MSRFIGCGWLCPFCVFNRFLNWLDEPSNRKPIRSIYIIGSLANPKVMEFAQFLRSKGFEAFDNWISPGPEADQNLLKYTQFKGLNYIEALKDPAAVHVYEWDKSHLDRCDAAIMCFPAGRSGHLELGYCIGKGKKGYIYFEELPTRLDVMYQFSSGLFNDLDALVKELKSANR